MSNKITIWNKRYETFKKKFVNRAGNVVAEDQEEVLLFIQETVEEILKAIELTPETPIEEHHDEFHFSCPRCVEIRAREVAIAELENIKTKVLSDMYNVKQPK